MTRLRTFCASRHHHFWPDAVSLTDQTLFDSNFLRGYAQVTDLYLLGLAKKIGGRLASLARAIPWQGIVGGHERLLEVIAPAPD